MEETSNLWLKSLCLHALQNPLRLLFETNMTNHNYPRLPEIIWNLVNYADTENYIIKLRN